MKTFLLTSLTITALIVFNFSATAQTKGEVKAVKAEEKTKSKTVGETKTNFPTVSLKPDATPLDMAKAALKAHGGDKFKEMKTLDVRGSVDVSTSTMGQPLAGSFAMISAGDRYRLQLQTPMIVFTQTFDGEQTYSSVAGFQIPPINRIGLPILARVGDAGFVVEALPDKKRRGFRITSPEGFATDFILDEKTAQVKSYSAVYSVKGRQITTAVEHDKFRDFDGVILPEKYSQRFDMGQMTAYASFKVKEVKVNSAVADDVFTLLQ
jgi:hypothetical protein